jgi:hypothetical protein
MHEAKPRTSAQILSQPASRSVVCVISCRLPPGPARHSVAVNSLPPVSRLRLLSSVDQHWLSVLTHVWPDLKIECHSSLHMKLPSHSGTAAENPLDSRTSRQNPRGITKTSVELWSLGLHSLAPTHALKVSPSFLRFPTRQVQQKIIKMHWRARWKGAQVLLTNMRSIPVSRHLTFQFQPQDVSTCPPRYKYAAEQS